MRQVNIGKELGISRAYISMVMSGKKKPSKKVMQHLVNKQVNIEANFGDPKSCPSASSGTSPDIELVNLLTRKQD